MTRRKELPWLECHETPYASIIHDGHSKYCETCKGRGEIIDCQAVPRGEAEMFAELVRRVLDKDDFMSFAKKCQKEIFEG